MSRESSFAQYSGKYAAIVGGIILKVGNFPMTKWRPAQSVQAKVIGICVNKGALLAMEVYADDGSIKGVRPLGGLIEFGETREQALQREFIEELDTKIELFGRWRTFENLYEHAGMRGHELIFAIGISLADKSLYRKDAIVFSEDSGTSNTARWFPIENIKSGSISLFPTGLLEAL